MPAKRKGKRLNSLPAAVDIVSVAVEEPSGIHAAAAASTASRGLKDTAHERISRKENAAGKRPAKIASEPCTSPADAAAQAALIKQLESCLAHLEFDNSVLISQNETIASEKKLLRGEISRSKCTEEQIRVQSFHALTELTRLSQLRQAGCIRRARDGARLAVDRIVAIGDASLLPGVQEWLAKHRLAGSATGKVLEWCAGNAAASVDDILCAVRGSDGMDAFVDALDLQKGQAEQLRQSLQKEHKDCLNAQSTAKSLRRKRGEGGAALVKKHKDELLAANRRAESLEQLVQDGIKDQDELEQARVEQRRAQQWWQRAQEAAEAVEFAWVVVSTPMKSADGSHAFRFVKALNNEFSDITIACDWPGSPNARSDDKEAFDAIFAADGLLKHWRDSGMSDQVLDEIAALVTATLWWQLYKGCVKGALRITALQGLPVKAVCIEGGPISRIEARLMQDIVDEVQLELSVLGKHDATVEVVQFAAVSDFERHFRAQTALWTKFDRQAEQPRAPVEAEPRSPASPKNKDAIARRWKEKCDHLHHANEHLWRDFCQRDPRQTKGPKAMRQPEALVLLHLEVDLLLEKTANLQAQFSPDNSGSLVVGLGQSRSRSTGCLPNIRTR